MQQLSSFDHDIVRTVVRETIWELNVESLPNHTGSQNTHVCSEQNRQQSTFKAFQAQLP